MLLKSAARNSDNYRMSKRIVMSIVTSLIVTIITTIGSFTCKDKGSDGIMLIVQHPDTCFLLDPNPLAAGMSTTADMVSVKPGVHTFQFDCDGKQFAIKKDVEPGHTIWNIDPQTGKESGGDVQIPGL